MGAFLRGMEVGTFGVGTEEGCSVWYGAGFERREDLGLLLWEEIKAGGEEEKKVGLT